MRRRRSRRRYAVRQGTTVSELTKKAGKMARVGKVIEVRGHDLEVRWEDGHISVISRNAVHEVHPKKG